MTRPPASAAAATLRREVPFAHTTERIGRATVCVTRAGDERIGRATVCVTRAGDEWRYIVPCLDGGAEDIYVVVQGRDGPARDDRGEPIHSDGLPYEVRRSGLGRVSVYEVGGAYSVEVASEIIDHLVAAHDVQLVVPVARCGWCGHEALEALLDDCRQRCGTKLCPECCVEDGYPGPVCGDCASPPPRYLREADEQ